MRDKIGAVVKRLRLDQLQGLHIRKTLRVINEDLRTRITQQMAKIGVLKQSQIGSLMLALWIVTVPISAKEVFDYPLKESNRAAFQNISKRLSNSPVVKGKFVQEKKIKILKKPLQSSGFFTVSAEKGVMWKTLKPFQSTLIVTQSGVWQEAYGKKAQMTTQSDQVMGQIMGIFFAIFQGREAELKKEFTLFFIQEGAQWELGLKAKKTSVLSKILPQVRISGSSEIQQFISEDKNGDTLEISFVDLSKSETLNPEDALVFSH